MAEKNYFEIADEGGVISIAHEVIGAIAALACREIDGVAAMASVAGAPKGIKITVDEGGVCALEVHILARLNAPLAQAARAAQEAVKAAVETGTGIALGRVDVYVAGVSQK